jgi:UDP-glucose 4-epimerase
MSGSEIQSQRLLVMGWGFIGSAVGHRLLSDKHSVVGFSRSETFRTKVARQQRAEIVIGDARDAKLLERALLGVSHVVYAAGGFLPPAAAADPLADATATLAPLIQTLEALATRPQIGFTYVSSGGTVYGNPARTPVRETDPTLPISPYGASRLAGEIYAQADSRTVGRVVQVVRCANVYGPGQPADRSQGAVAVFMHRVAQGLPVSIVGDGSAVRDYVYIDDVAGAIAQLIDPAVDAGTVNVGSGAGHSVMELLDNVSDVAGRPAILDFQPARPHDVGAIVLDISKLRTLVSYEPIPLMEGLRRTWSARRPGRSKAGVGVT